MEKIKELTVDLLEELDNKYKEQEEIMIDISTQTGTSQATLLIDKVFSPKKINECIKEFIGKIEVLRKYREENEDSTNLFQAWLILLIVKHFSTLDVPNDFHKQIAVLGKMLEANILLQIYGKFNTVEIEKVTYELNLTIGKLNLKLNEIMKNQEMKE